MGETGQRGKGEVKRERAGRNERKRGGGWGLELEVRRHLPLPFLPRSLRGHLCSMALSRYKRPLLSCGAADPAAGPVSALQLQRAPQSSPEIPRGI